MHRIVFKAVRTQHDRSIAGFHDGLEEVHDGRRQIFEETFFVAVRKDC